MSVHREVKVRTVLSCAAMFLLGCVSRNEEQILADPSTVIGPDGALSDVQIIGEIGLFRVGTREGWGTARAWNSTETGNPSFAIDVRGEGIGVVMSRIEVHGIDFSELEVETTLDMNDPVYDLSYIESEGLGCGGYEEYEWDIDLPHTAGTLTVVEKDEEAIALLLDFAFGTSWTKAALVLPTTLPTTAY